MNLIKNNKNFTITLAISGFALLFALLLVAAAIPSLLPAALANNIWSLETIDIIFKGKEAGKEISAPPPYHPHASIWISRQDLSQMDPREEPSVLETLDPQQIQAPSGNQSADNSQDFSDIQSMDVRARYLYQQGQYLEAIELWKSIGQKAALVELASEASDYGITSLAIQAYQAAYELDPEGYTLSLARALHGNGESDRALALLNTAQQVFPSSSFKSSWLVLMGDIYRGQEAWTEAEAAYQSLLAENPASAGAWIGMGWLAYQRDGDIEQTVALFERAMAVDPQNGQGQAAMGSLFSQRAEYDIAAEWYRVACERDRDNPGYALSYASALRSAGKEDQALAEYENVIQRFPEYANGFYEIAWVYHQEGRSREAIIAIETALSMSDMVNLSHYLRAVRIYEAEQMTAKIDALYQFAEEAFLEGVERFPNFPESHLQIARFYEAFGQTDQALAAYQRALDLDPDNPIALDALERLEARDL